jgi:type VI secretion system secreted protein VgrG
MSSITQTGRLLTFTSPLGDDVLLPERLSGSEGISELFCYKLDLLAATGTTVDPTDIVGKRVCIGLQCDDDGTERYINGFVSSFEMLNGDQEYNYYRATIVPSLWMLTLTKNTRVFQNQTVTDVIQAVLSPYSISPSLQTSNTYTPLDYCTQYRESDFNFISRLMEQSGIFYYFQHTEDDHTLVLHDTSSKLSDCPIQNSFEYQPEVEDRGGYYDFFIHELTSRSTMVTGKYTSWDFSFIGAQTIDGTDMPTAGPLGDNSNEAYDYAEATGYLKKEASDQNLKSLVDFFGTARRDASDAETSIIEGASNAVCMQTGYTFSITDHPQDAINDKYVLVHNELSVQQVPSYRSSNKEVPQPFVNAFRAMPFSIVYRSPIITEKPLVYGMHTGVVVVSSGEDSYMDKYGRVNVQFWWDRLRKPNTPDNTWLRVAQQWAGKGWGTYFWPRVGDEVLIGFMEGDPDQPIVVGSVYNGVNMPKYDPAGQYTMSGILTRSSKGGGAANANELRFEDLAGKEQIFMNAEKDYDLHVEHDWHTTVGNEQHVTVTSNRFDQVGGDSHLKISGKHNEEIDGDSSQLVKGQHLEEVDGDAHLNIKGKNVVQVGGDRQHTMSGNLMESVGQNSNISVGSNLNEQVGQNYSLTVGMNQAISAGMNFDVSAPMQISFSCGPNSIFLSPEGIGLNGAGGFISITPAGIALSGMLININSAGAPVMGSPGMAQSPQSPSGPTAPNAPTAPTFPGDDPYSQAATSQAGSAGTAPQITDSPGSGGGGSSPSSPAPAAAPPAAGSPAAAVAGAAAGAAGAAAGAVGQAEQAAQQAANQAVADTQQALQETQQLAQKAEQEGKQAYNEVVDKARQAYNRAQQAVNEAKQAVSSAVGQAKQLAQQQLNQAEQLTQQAAQSAAGAVQSAQQELNSVEQKAQTEVNNAKQAAKEAQQYAQQTVSQAKNAAQQAVQPVQQQLQQAVQKGQQAVQQAKQTAQGAASQVKQAAAGGLQQAQQASQGAQQSAQQAMNSAKQGF